MSRVFVPIAISGIEEEKEQPSLTYKLDLKVGRIVGKVDGLEAVNQYIEKALLTPRFHCLVYDNQYGSEIKDTIKDESATEELIKSEIPRLVEDAPFPRTSKRKSGTFSARRRRRLRPSSTSSPPKEDRNGKELCM